MAVAERRQSSGNFAVQLRTPACFLDYYDLPPSPCGLWRAELLISSKNRRSLQGEDGPGKDTMLPCTTAAFTSTGIPDDFAVLLVLP
jgi:hypothetical protein